LKKKIKKEFPDDDDDDDEQIITSVDELDCSGRIGETTETLMKINECERTIRISPEENQETNIRF